MNDWVFALKVGLRAGVRTLAQTLAGGMTALVVADIRGFEEVPEVALVIGFGALVAGLAAFLMNFAENLKDM